MITLSNEQVIRLHRKIIETSGGDAGIRDAALLESALVSPLQTFEGADLYPTTPEKIARITYSLVSNHPFVDGNKRIGTFVLILLLELNNIDIVFSDDEVIHIGMSLATGEMNYDELLDILLKKILIRAKPSNWVSETTGTYG
jgi:death-on-curing protein